MKNGFHVLSRMFTRLIRVNVFAFILFVLLVSSSAWAAGGTMPGSGTEADPYIISDASKWDELVNLVNEGYSLEGKFLKLGIGHGLHQRRGVAPGTRHHPIFRPSL